MGLGVGERPLLISIYRSSMGVSVCRRVDNQARVTVSGAAAGYHVSVEEGRASG